MKQRICVGKGLRVLLLDDRDLCGLCEVFGFLLEQRGHEMESEITQTYSLSRLVCVWKVDDFFLF